MAAWLSSFGVEKVAMEATACNGSRSSRSWTGPGFEVMLPLPPKKKQISDSKSDMLDCQ